MQTHEESNSEKHERPPAEADERPLLPAEESMLSGREYGASDRRNHDHAADESGLSPRARVVLAEHDAISRELKGAMTLPLGKTDKQEWKACYVGGWAESRERSELWWQCLRRGDLSIGVGLGRVCEEHFGVLADVDCEDKSEYPRLWRKYGLATAYEYERPDGLSSHHFFWIDSEYFYKTTRVELRAESGKQTRVPGPEPTEAGVLRWLRRAAPACVSTEALLLRVCEIEALSLLLQVWPGEGEGRRHAAYLALSGLLVKAAVRSPRPEQALSIANTLVERLVNETGDDDPKDRLSTFASAVKKASTDADGLSGRAKLAETLGNKAVTELLMILGNIGFVAPRSRDTGSPFESGEADNDRRDVREAVERLNGQHFVTTSGGRTLIATRAQHIVTGEDEWVTSGLADFRARYMNESLPWGRGRKDLGSIWLQHPQRRQFLGGIRMIPEGGAPPDVFNTWTGLAISPREGVYPRLDYHIREIICAGNAERAEYLLNWFARLLQRPGLVGEVVPVLRGGQGTGKSILAHAIARMFGRHALPVSKPDHFVGRFNRHLRDVVFLFLDEAFFAGDRSVVGYMKTLITEPTLLIEAKGVDAEVHRNRLSIMIASNSDQVIAAAADERRYAVFEVSAAKQRDEAYFSKLVKAIHQDGELEAFAFEMLRRPIDTFNPQRIPSSAGLFQQKVLGDSLVRSVFQILDEQVLDGEIDPSGDIWFGMTHGKGPGWMPVMKRALYAQAKERHHGNRNYFDAEETFGKRLKELLGDAVQLGHKASYPVRREQVRSRTVGEGETVEYNLRDFDWERRTVYRFAPLEECRRAFERAVNHSAAEIGWSEVDRSPERLAIAAEHAEAFLNKRFRSEHLATEEERAERELRDAAF